MVYAINMPEDEENKNPSQGAIAPAGGGTPVGASSGVGSVGAGPGAGAPKPGQPGAGGSFATLDKYITANQGQAQPLASKVTQGIQGEYNTLAGQGQQTLQDIGGQVQAARTPENAESVIAAEAANPVSFSKDQGNVQNFQNLLKATYGGPGSAEEVPGFTAHQNAVNQAIATGKQQTTTEAGREQLLAKHEKAPSTSVTGLNSAILSHSPEALGQVESAYKPFSNLLTNLSQGAENINKDIAAAKQRTEATKQAANQAVTSQISELNKGVEGGLTKAQQAAAAQLAKTKANLAAGNPDAEDLKALGMTTDQWKDLSGAQKAAATSEFITADARNQFGAQSGTVNLNLGDFLNTQDPNTLLTAANTATPEQYEKAAAFQNLLKGLYTGAPAISLNPADAAKAGTAPSNFQNFDYQTALNTAKNAKEQEMAGTKAYVDALQAGADEEHAQLKAKEAAQKVGAYGLGTLATGVWAPGAAGYGEGAYNSVGNAISKPTMKNAAEALNAIAGPKGISNIAKGVATGVTGAVNTVQKIFCFHPDTLVDMADGTTMPISKVAVGDHVKGGLVLATTRAIGHDFHWYKGVLVTGKHAVKEDGRWIRVETSKFAMRLPKYVEIVHSLVTSDHRIWVGDIEFADQHENDDYENLNLEDSLAELNKNG